MRPLISVIVPTRGRTHLLASMLLSLMSTAEDQANVEVIMRVDFDDDESIAYLRTSPFPFPFIVGPRYKGYATLGMFINEAARMSRGDLVLVINDDVEFRTRGWDARLLAHAALYPDGIFNIGVEVENADNFIFPCVSRRQVQVLDGVFDARLIYPDIGLRDVLRAFDRAVRVHDVVLRHNWQGMSVEQMVAQPMTQSTGYEALYGQCVREGIERLADYKRSTVCKVHVASVGVANG